MSATGTARAQYPAPWPDESGVGDLGQWTPFTLRGGSIQDLEGASDGSTGGTAPTGAVDISGGQDTPPVPSGYIAYDALRQVLFFRLRLGNEPLASGVGRDGNALLPAVGSGPWQNGSWNLTIDLDGDGFLDFLVALDGSSGGGANDIESSVNGLGFTAFGAPMHSGDDLLVYHNALGVGSHEITPHGVSAGALTAIGELVWATEAVVQDATGDGLSGGAF
ncbi:MAG: hypothetical protein OEY14_17230, partial [Myxococcales bacterium]|nr:hypothetical protein [Myxococcales bacterium]